MRARLLRIVVASPLAVAPALAVPAAASAATGDVLFVVASPTALTTGEAAVRNGEVRNLALDLLGYAAIPGSLLDADQSLDLAS